MTGISRIVVTCASLAVFLCAEAYPDPYEEILKDVEAEEDYLNLLNQLDTIIREPVNLLDADRDQLSRLPWVSPWLAREIVSLRKRGELGGLEDLEKIPGIDRRLIDLIRPFVIVIPVTKAGPSLNASLRMRVIASPVAGSYREVKTYLRSQASYSRYDMGLLAEKDRNEDRFNDLQTGFAGMRFSSGRFIIGDIIMVSGHGLVFSNPYGYSPSTVEPWRFSQGDFGIKPYTSVDENFALRGLGVEYGGKQTRVCVAMSRTHFDASIDQDGRVKSLVTTGLHTDSGENEDALREDLLGVAVRTRRGRVGLGLDVLLAEYGCDFGIDRLDHLGKTWKPTGSVDLSFLGESSTAFVQGAVSDGGGGAVIGGFGYDRQEMELLLLGRYYGERFLSLHARPFAFYSGLATGERGLLTRIAFRLPAAVRVSIGNDLHARRPEQAGLARPSGSESFLDLELPLGDFTFGMGEKLLTTEEPPAHETDPTATRVRLRSRLDMRYDPAGWLDIRLRYENMRFTEDRGPQEERASSDLLRVDLAGEIGRRVVLKAGFHTFTIGSYGARIYQYEPGVPYYPAIEMLKTDGSRWYSVLSFDMSPLGKLAAKYATTIYEADADRCQFFCYYSLRI
jgi:hypothetical protein